MIDIIIISSSTSSSVIITDIIVIIALSKTFICNNVFLFYSIIHKDNILVCTILLGIKNILILKLQQEFLQRCWYNNCSFVSNANFSEQNWMFCGQWDHKECDYVTSLLGGKVCLLMLSAHTTRWKSIWKLTSEVGLPLNGGTRVRSAVFGYFRPVASIPACFIPALFGGQ